MTNAIQRKRIAFWGTSYLDSTHASLRQAREFEHKGDFFTAYMYLFVAFNNLYSFLAGFAGHESDKIEAAIKLIPRKDIDAIYDASYVALISRLNDGPPEQLQSGPDRGIHADGIMNMRDYFLGRDVSDCVSHVGHVAGPQDPPDQKVSSLVEVAAKLLFTVRNNQFHAVKGSRNIADLSTLEIAYRVLEPLVELLLPLAARQVERLKSPGA